MEVRHFMGGRGVLGGLWVKLLRSVTLAFSPVSNLIVAVFL